MGAWTGGWDVASNPPSEKASLGWYNVKIDYGAKGDGVTNDSAAFQAAVTAAAASTNGGYVVLPPGTYLLNSAITGMGTTVSFMGYGATLTGAGASSVNATFVNWVPASGSLSFGAGTPGGLDTPLWAINASPAARGRMGVSYAENLFNGAVVDPTLMIGYNLSGGGTLPLAGEPGVGWGFEGYYDDVSGQIKMESYLQYENTDLTYYRPIFTQYNRTTREVKLELKGTLQMAIRCPQINFVPGGDGAVVHNMGLNMNGGANVMYLFDTPLGAAGAAISVGVQDNAAIGTFAVGASDVSIKGLVVRGKASQTANLFEAQDESSVAHVYITAGHSTKIASLVVGKAALATTATDGFLYLPTCAGTPTGVPTTRTGTVAHVYDTTAHKLWVYDAGWKGIVVA